MKLTIMRSGDQCNMLVDSENVHQASTACIEKGLDFEVRHVDVDVEGLVQAIYAAEGTVSRQVASVIYAMQVVNGIIPAPDVQIVEVVDPANPDPMQSEIVMHPVDPKDLVVPPDDFTSDDPEKAAEG